MRVHSRPTSAIGTTALQSLREQTRALAVPPDHLDQVAPTDTIGEEMTTLGICLESLPGLRRKLREPLEHVGRSAGEQDARRRWRRVHLASTPTPGTAPVNRTNPTHSPRGRSATRCRRDRAIPQAFPQVAARATRNDGGSPASTNCVQRGPRRHVVSRLASPRSAPKPPIPRTAARNSAPRSDAPQRPNGTGVPVVSPQPTTIMFISRSWTSSTSETSPGTAAHIEPARCLPRKETAAESDRPLAGLKSLQCQLAISRAQRSVHSACLLATYA